jgi:hypothetical protein
MRVPVPFHVGAISIAVAGEVLTSFAREEFSAVPNRHEQRTKARKSRVAVWRSIGTSIGPPVINQALEEDLLCDNQTQTIPITCSVCSRISASFSNLRGRYEPSLKYRCESAALPETKYIRATPYCNFSAAGSSGHTKPMRKVQVAE